MTEQLESDPLPTERCIGPEPGSSAAEAKPSNHSALLWIVVFGAVAVLGAGVYAWWFWAELVE